jgi:hypothetical protein
MLSIDATMLSMKKTTSMAFFDISLGVCVVSTVTGLYRVPKQG